MDKKNTSGASHLLARFRGWIQAGAALLTNLHLPNFLKGGLYQGAGKTVCVPGLNCYSCPAASAFKDFRDRMLGLHPVEDYGISVEELVSNAQAVVDERFAGNTPRDIDLQAAEQLLEGFGSR